MQKLQTEFLNGGAANRSTTHTEDAMTRERALREACEPWEFGIGDPPEYESPLTGVFCAGMAYTERLLAQALGVTQYEGGDGSEDFDCDATNTLLNILAAANIYDKDEGKFAALASAQQEPAPAADAEEASRIWFAGCVGFPTMQSREAFRAGWLAHEAAALRPYAGDSGVTARPLSEWHEDVGPALWWFFPIQEPPYAGTPLDSNWPNYCTHWTPLVVPTAAARAKSGGAP